MIDPITAFGLPSRERYVKNPWRSLALVLGVSVFGLDIALASAHCGDAVLGVTAAVAPSAHADPHAGHDMGAMPPSTPSAQAVPGIPADPEPDAAPRPGIPPCCIAFGGCLLGTGLTAGVAEIEEAAVSVAVVPATLAAPSSRGAPPDPPPPRA